MEYALDEVHGLDAELQEKLKGLGITNTTILIERARTPTGRKDLAEQLGIEVGLVTSFYNRADLMRLNGVGKEMANLLEECGVDSIKELRHRVPADLQATLKAVNDQQKITHHAPTLTQVEAWIVQAKEFDVDVA